LLEFFMLFLAVFLGFIAENIREHSVEKERLHQYLRSMLSDINRNTEAMDSAIKQNKTMIVNYRELMDGLLQDTFMLDRFAFAKKMGAVWYRGFINKNETFEQMKSSGTLRYIRNENLLNGILQYQTVTNFAQYRTEHFEQKYYTENFLPTLYRNFDLPCLHFLDTAYTNHPEFLRQFDNHSDILTERNAKKFRQEVGAAFMLRLERLRVTITAYQRAILEAGKLKPMIEKELN
ncbi:MAG: hypothetical protein ICV66_14055, partial [Chitinophagaceae bacterium]|nr:hypothetical protein [Chitinophagaceae bacterium]